MLVIGKKFSVSKFFYNEDFSSLISRLFEWLTAPNTFSHNCVNSKDTDITCSVHCSWYISNILYTFKKNIKKNQSKKISKKKLFRDGEIWYILQKSRKLIELLETSRNLIMILKKQLNSYNQYIIYLIDVGMWVRANI